MNKEELTARIKDLEARRTQCQDLVNKLQPDILLLTGAITENTNWLNAFIAQEENAKVAKEKELAKKNKLKAKKVKTPTIKAVEDDLEAEDEAQAA